MLQPTKNCPHTEGAHTCVWWGEHCHGGESTCSARVTEGVCGEGNTVTVENQLVQQGFWYDVQNIFSQTFQNFPVRCLI